MGIRIALAGNPNCGKTTMFNDLTGSAQHVGNWPGVTVEKKEGRLRGHPEVMIVDLPGIYSLSPYTMEEVVSRNYLLHERPDAIINLVDGTNLERNLYLTTQLLEIGIPVVLAVNMIDLVRKNGDQIDLASLGRALGCMVLETAALKGAGSMEAAEAAIALAGTEAAPHRHAFQKHIEQALSEIEAMLPDGQARWYAVKLFERDEKVQQELTLPTQTVQEIEQRIAACEEEIDDDSGSIITNERYAYIGKLIQACTKKKPRAMTPSDRIDRVVTNRWLALPIFFAVMTVVYLISVTWIGTLVTDWTNDRLFGTYLTNAVTSGLEAVGAAAWLQSLLVDGIVAGVGAVLGFVPQMFLLFFFLSILEDCGYMARVAFIMDRIFRKFGLSGKSFIPMLISSGCGVPGIMATKTIENEKDRRMTIMTTTFIPCSAKLPVIALIGGALFPNIWFMAPAMYFLGVAAVIVSGVILKKTRMFAGDPAPFVMELPQYHIPAPKSVLMHMWERVRAFIIKAGTVIFLACGVIWFLSSFGFENGAFGMVEANASLLAVLGGWLAPLFAPLGFGSWQATVVTISGLVAKENVVGTFGVLLGLGDVTEGDPALLTQVSAMFPQGAAALSFLVFNLLCAPCFAAIGAIRREMSSAKWTFFAIGYQTGLAYAAALMIYQFGSLLAGGTFGFGTAAALLVLVGLLFLLFRPNHTSRPTHTRKKRMRAAEISC